MTTKDAMEALDQLVNADAKKPSWGVKVFCVHCNTEMKTDPMETGRRICFGCNGVVEVVAKKWSEKWGK